MKEKPVTLRERIERYVEACPSAISGQRGHDQTFRVACILVQGFDLSPEDAYSFLARYNQRCEPPWSKKELWHKLADADKTLGSLPRGYLLSGRGKLEPASPASLSPGEDSLYSSCTPASEDASTNPPAAEPGIKKESPPCDSVGDASDQREEPASSPDAEPTGVSVPFQITRQTEVDLRARGYSQPEIDKLTPQQAHEILATPATPDSGSDQEIAPDIVIGEDPEGETIL